MLDYGLAKALEGDAPGAGDSELSQSPTLTRQGTQVGVILGTAAYMSPEQAKGKQVDKRADIWSFGVVLYEMLTGKRAFEGEDVSGTLAAVLRATPDWSRLPSDTPESVRELLRLCLSKESKERVRDVGDVRLVLGGAFTGSTHDGAERLRTGLPSGIAVAGALALAVAASVASVSLWSTTPSRPPAAAKFRLGFGPDGTSVNPTVTQMIALSSDGSRFVYVANDTLYVRDLDRLEATPIRGTEGASVPFLSPDAQWVGFGTRGELRKVHVDGSAPVTLCDADYLLGARWGEDGTIVFGQRTEGIMRVSAEGGAPEVLVPHARPRDNVHGPQVLPGGKAVLLTTSDAGNDWDDTRVVVYVLETGAQTVLIEDGRDARYVPTGHLVYVHEHTLLAVPFDVDALEVTGGPVPIAEQVATASFTGAAHFGVSDNGAMVYLENVAFAGRTMVWVDRDGNEEAIPAEPRAYRYPRISPDGSRVAVDSLDEEIDLWIWDFERETLVRFTYDSGEETYPLWSPDGQRLLFASGRDGVVNMYWKASDGSGGTERLLETSHPQFPHAFTPDGTQLVFHDWLGGTARHLGVLDMDGSSRELLATEFIERNPEISPDGRWLAYESNASGQFEVYVRPFPNVDEGRRAISYGGGTAPLWSPDGSELFYVAPGAKLIAVAVETEPSFSVGRAEEVLTGYYMEGEGRTYDISPDGERFLMISEDAHADEGGFVFVQNWLEELNRLVPTE